MVGLCGGGGIYRKDLATLDVFARVRLLLWVLVDAIIRLSGETTVVAHGTPRVALLLSLVRLVSGSLNGGTDFLPLAVQSNAASVEMNHGTGSDGDLPALDARLSFPEDRARFLGGVDAFRSALFFQARGTGWHGIVTPLREGRLEREHGSNRKDRPASSDYKSEVAC